MKSWLTATLLVALTIVGCAAALAQPPTAVAQAPVPPPPGGVQKDGPFRLLVAARAHAKHRRGQGFRTEVVKESGMWWVVFYP
jgi:hypothetical protein